MLRPELPALGAIGDSAVIDFAGLGGQARLQSDASGFSLQVSDYPTLARP